MSSTVVLALVLVLAGLAAGGVAIVVLARRAAPHPGLQQLLDTNRAILEQERVRSAQELDGKHQLIGHELGRVSDQMAQLDRMLRELETDRRARFGELASELTRQHQAVDSLHQTTQQLREALASTKVRGQWGERMAEDVLRLAGLIEGVNYRKQQTLTSGGRPDFTFLLPNGQQMHMDVKFPLDNYVRFLESDTDLERKQHRDQFLKDVRECVKGLARRRYLEADDPTIDCLLLFIPNEGVYAFLQQHDASIADAALRDKIVLCSPLTLYAVLAVVRQAVDNFRLERASHEILGLLGEFHDQWGRYVEQLDRVQQRFEGVHKEYGALMATRQRALQRPLDKIEALRQEQRLDSSDRATPPTLTPLALDA